jgi:hypothetical protein
LNSVVYCCFGIFIVLPFMVTAIIRHPWKTKFQGKLNIFPYDTLIRPGTFQGTALRNILAANPTVFHSCVYLSDGKPHPNCQK